MSDSTTNKRLLTVKETADYLGYEPDKLYRDLLKRPDFPSFKFGEHGEWKIDKNKLDEWIGKYREKYMV